METLNDASSCTIPVTQNIVIVQDDDLNKVAKADISLVLKQV
jgi:hypothetical protein